MVPVEGGNLEWRCVREKKKGKGEGKGKSVGEGVIVGVESVTIGETLV